MLPSIVQLPLFDNKPLPLLVAENWEFPLSSIRIGETHFFNVRQWLFGMFSDNQYADQSIRNLRRPDGLFSQYVHELHTSQELDGKRRMRNVEYATDVFLYRLTQNMLETTRNGKRDMERVNAIREYLAESGAYVDRVRINPEEMAIQALDYARRKEISTLINEGFTPDEAEQWVANRIEQKQERRITVAEWGKRGAKGREFGRLTNEVTSVAIGQSARELKEEMGVTDSLRDHLSTAQNVAIKITEFTSRMLHIGRNSEGVEELAEDIKDTRPIIDAARPEIERAFSKKPRRLKGQDQPKLLEDK